MTWPLLLEPADVFNPGGDPAPLEVITRANNIQRVCGIPLARRGELLAFLATVPPVEPATPLLGAAWRWGDVVAAMRKRAPDLIPEVYR